jgi:Transglycosylase-like domain
LKLDKAALICAAALAATLATAPGLGTTAAQAPTEEFTEAAKRYRTDYEGWRERLQRHGVFVGRDLLMGIRAAGGSIRPPTEQELRSSIRRMQKRWGRWLRTTADGRSLAFRQKVRHRVPGWGKANLRSIAACESHNNPRAIGGGGIYRGLYQFSLTTWRVVGGYGDPAAASRWEQTWRAWLLLSRHGSGHWPACG